MSAVNNKIMKRLFALIVILLMVATILVAQTRRTREEEFVRKILSITERETLVQIIKACDPDGDQLFIEIDDLPIGAILSQTSFLAATPDPQECPNDPNCLECFDPNNPDIKWHYATLTWTPDYSQSGEHHLHIHAVDDRGGDDWVIYIINVSNKNRPPVL